MLKTFEPITPRNQAIQYYSVSFRFLTSRFCIAAGGNNSFVADIVHIIELATQLLDMGYIKRVFMFFDLYPLKG